jgi:phosphate transport system protein
MHAMSDHIVSAYTDELEALASDLLRMGGIAEAMIRDACKAVSLDDLELARDVVSRDPELDTIQMDVERRITSLIARRQPMAHDLRTILSAMKIAGEVERIGDLSKNIAKRAAKLDNEISRTMRAGILRMSHPVSRQLNLVLDAYASGNAAAARDVWNDDDEIDQHYNSLFREMLTYLIEDPRKIGAGAHMLFMAKNLERIGDHCTNIAELIFYQSTGEYLAPTERPKSPGE